MNIQELLLAYDAAVVKQLARDQNLEIKNLGKDQVARLLNRHFAGPAQIARALAQLKPAERTVLDYIQRAGGEVFAEALKQVLLQAKVVAPTPEKKGRYSYLFEPYIGNPSYTGKPALEDVAARLFKLGLVFGHGVVFGNRQVIGLEGGKSLVIPSEIFAHLPPVQAAEESIPTPAHTLPGSARNLQRDLSRYWSFVRRSGALELMSQGWLYKKTVTEIAALLGWSPDKKRDEKSDLHLFFLRRLLMDLNLLGGKISGWDAYNAQTWVAHEEAFWARSPQERIRAAFEAWRDGSAWNELRIPPTTYGADHRKPAVPELVAARKLVLERILKRGAGKWVALDTLRDDIRLARYEFLFPRHRDGYAFNSYRSVENTPYHQANNTFGITYKDIKDEATGWDRVEGAIIRHIVTGPLFWLGLVDLGSDKQDAPATAFRLNETGAWLLGLQDAVIFSQEGGRLVVQPNFQIVAMEPIADGILMSLDAFAQFEGGEHALLYRLTRESLYRGQRSGWDAARVISFLQEMTRAPLPQNVGRSLQEWQTQHERITIRRNIPLFQVDDSAILDAWFADSASASQWGKRVAPRLVLSHRDAQSTLRALRDAGLFPLVTRAGQTDAPASLTADESGALEFFGHAPDIYAYAAVEPFAEILDEHHAQFTPTSVQAAVANGISIPEILARLDHVHRGAVPPGLVQRLKAWGKFYGDARLGQLTLVEFRDEAARQELLADPELKAYLKPFEAGARPLVLVQAEHVEYVRALLQARGIELGTL